MNVPDWIIARRDKALADYEDYTARCTPGARDEKEDTLRRTHAAWSELVIAIEEATIGSLADVVAKFRRDTHHSSTYYASQSGIEMGKLRKEAADIVLRLLPQRG